MFETEIIDTITFYQKVEIQNNPELAQEAILYRLWLKHYTWPKELYLTHDQSKTFKIYKKQKYKLYLDPYSDRILSFEIYVKNNCCC